ncbi:glycine betaine ABC transporter substrate-binding protein [Actinomadura barringtoniae]|uniref:Glycine betaine ABC transporter substrate-binding protein n=1 Tax=Actinomadura barringtoniae TaxID=1427535 RepID=A0A939P9L5_9ACTN|nr:glycine betaine ABC transporter substrate-binding protein [Actinomadura barringtoniae]MBO2445878.1 glycine betaine ABC transporter substrate-binding protein [Actinomadura barringtoniae]
MRAFLALVSALLLMAAAACGLKPASAFVPNIEPGSIQPLPGLKDATIKVTSKEFTEQLILGKIAVLALTAAGAKVEDHTNVQGSVTARKSLTGGDNDLMWEYTGTGWITYLGEDDPIQDPQKQWEAVRDADLKKNGIVWLGPYAPLNNTYAMAVTKASQSKFGLKNLSDMAKVPVAQRTYCVEPEFFSRNDGMRGMLQTYGIPYGSSSGVPAGNVKQMSSGVVYSATSQGNCTFGEVYTTDGRIQGLGLQVLNDDKKFFPNYNADVTVREAVMRAHPEIRQVFAQISPKLTTDVMRDLNSQVDVDGNDPVFVARDWMKQQGFIK